MNVKHFKLLIGILLIPVILDPFITDYALKTFPDKIYEVNIIPRILYKTHPKLLYITTLIIVLGFYFGEMKLYDLTQKINDPKDFIGKTIWIPSALLFIFYSYIFIHNVSVLMRFI